MSSARKIFFFIVFMFLVFSLFKNFSGFRKNLSFYKGYKEEVEKERRINTKLKTQKLQKSSMREVEKTIRNKLNLLKPNEIAVIIPPASPTPSPAVTPILPVYRQWWDVFFKVD